MLTFSVYTEVIQDGTVFFLDFSLLSAHAEVILLSEKNLSDEEGFLCISRGYSVLLAV